jgi:hypothetical protein
MLQGTSWKMNPTILGIALLTIADASSFWSANNPSFFTVRHFTTQGDQKAADTRTDIYAGGAKATVETVIVGFGGVLITKSWWPLAAPLAYMGICWAWYKWALDNPHDNAEPIADQSSMRTEVNGNGYYRTVG